MTKLRSRLGVAAIPVFGVLCLIPIGWQIVNAPHPWIKPTDPDVRLKPTCRRRSREDPPSCTGIFIGRFVLPNPSGIAGQTTMAQINKQCPWDETISEIQ